MGCGDPACQEHPRMTPPSSSPEQGQVVTEANCRKSEMHEPHYWGAVGATWHLCLGIPDAQARIRDLEAALVEIAEDIIPKEDVWRFSDETEAVLRAVLAPPKEAQP